MPYEDLDEVDAASDDDRHPRQRQPRRDRHADSPRSGRQKLGRSPRNEADQAFKCGHCRAFIGAPVTGGRNRNHCPMCLYSRHVDRKMPGDRLADCGSLMAPVGLTERRNGEEMIVHRCLGCGHEHPNRVAADDNPSVLADLPLMMSNSVADAVIDSSGDQDVMI